MRIEFQFEKVIQKLFSFCNMVYKIKLFYEMDAFFKYYVSLNFLCIRLTYLVYSPGFSRRIISRYYKTLKSSLIVFSTFLSHGNEPIVRPSVQLCPAFDPIPILLEKKRQTGRRGQEKRQGHGRGREGTEKRRRQKRGGKRQMSG